MCSFSNNTITEFYLHGLVCFFYNQTIVEVFDYFYDALTVIYSKAALQVEELN